MKQLNKLVMIVMLAMIGVLAVSYHAEASTKKVSVKNVKSVNSLTGSKTIYLAKGKKATLKTTVTVTPNKSANKKVTYKSSNKKVATVTSKGVITGKKVGTAKITVISKKNPKKKATITVKVVKGKITSIKLNKTSETLNIGDSVKLTATVKVSKGGKKNIVWSSSDVKVATVKSGTVQAVGMGTATITVKAADGTGKKATYKVTVQAKSATTEDSSTTETTTENPTPETPANILQNTEGKNVQDVAVLEKIIQEQISKGAKVSTDLNDGEYIWSESGQLTGIWWGAFSFWGKDGWESYDDYFNLQGEISFEGLKSLKSLTCYGYNLTGLDVSKNTALESLT